jgi:hypothetical protein
VPCGVEGVFNTKAIIGKDFSGGVAGPEKPSLLLCPLKAYYELRTADLLNHLQLFPYLDKCCNSMIKMLLVMSCGDLHPDPVFSFRYYRE